MRNFNTRFRLRDSDRQIRLVYTFFLLFMVAAFGFSFFWAHSMTELTPGRVAEHYLGSDATFGEPMSFRELSEITHFHLFTMPVLFMILIHVLYLTESSQRTKIWTTWAAFGGVALDLVSPWLIRYLSPFFALTMLLGDVLMGLSFLVLVYAPFRDLWITGRPLMGAARPDPATTPAPPVG